MEAHTETRVHLGPFKTRAEADEASTKLKTLGFTLAGSAEQINPDLTAPVIATGAVRRNH